MKRSDAAPNRRPAGQEDGSDGLDVTIAADPALLDGGRGAWLFAGIYEYHTRSKDREAEARHDLRRQHGIRRWKNARRQLRG